jgi:phospholipase A1/A2
MYLGANMIHWIRSTSILGACVLGLGGFTDVSAQTVAPDVGWQQCARLVQDKDARLSCFDRWASKQTDGTTTLIPAASVPVAGAERATPANAEATPPVTIVMTAPTAHDCSNSRFSELSRFWELEAGSDCGTFSIRGYRPISLSLITSDSVNTQPTSPSTDHTATSALPYSRNETRIQLSVRTKIAQGLLSGNSLARDSLWFGYSQQSYWQFFNPGLSRPFRTTDHEPEITYIYPIDATLPLGWRLRYAGVSAVHQSNGQSLPLSRSWNRTVVLAGIEKGDKLRVTGRVWQRTPEAAADDDNPNISDFIGRGEVAGYWDASPRHTFGVTVRHSLRAQGRGALRLEWLRTLGDAGQPFGKSGLRLHTQLFSGYGDSLVDYNRRRTLLSVGLSLVDW